MEPKYVVYQCEECGNLFYREVAEVFTDDADHCDVRVALVAEKETNEIEEFPMCGCLGGDGGYVIGNINTITSSTSAEESAEVIG
jgi:hypothetical protein